MQILGFWFAAIVKKVDNHLTSKTSTSLPTYIITIQKPNISHQPESPNIINPRAQSIFVSKPFMATMPMVTSSPPAHLVSQQLSASSADMDLPQRVQSLPPELFEMVYDHRGNPTIPGSHLHRSQLQAPRPAPNRQTLAHNRREGVLQCRLIQVRREELQERLLLP